MELHLKQGWFKVVVAVYRCRAHRFGACPEVLCCVGRLQITLATGDALSERHLGTDSVSFSFWTCVHGVEGEPPALFKWPFFFFLPSASVNCEEGAAPLYLGDYKANRSIVEWTTNNLGLRWLWNHLDLRFFLSHECTSSVYQTSLKPHSSFFISGLFPSELGSSPNKVFWRRQCFPCFCFCFKCIHSVSRLLGRVLSSCHTLSQLRRLWTILISFFSGNML